MSDTNKNVDLGKKDELIKKESAFIDLLSMAVSYTHLTLPTTHDV